MKRKTAWSRMNATAHVIGSQPLALPAIDRAYAKFLRTGELAEGSRLAWAVLHRALHARKVAADIDGHSWFFEPKDDDPVGCITGSPRERVFREASNGPEPVREAARLLIGILVGAGSDPTDLDFIPSSLEEPEFGGVAMHALGWPDLWVKPPYESQMQRVMQQHERLRTNTARSEAWYRDAGAGLSAFLTRGTIPSAADVQMFALTIGEMFAIHAHYFGEGEEPLLAAFEAVARASGTKRDVALVQLGSLQGSDRLFGEEA